MELTVHEPVSHAQQAVTLARKQAKRTRKRARRRAIDAARTIHLHEPARAAKAAAKKAAKHAGNRGGKRTTAAAGRVAKQKSRSAARRVTRVGVTALAAGALVAVTVVMIRGIRARSGPDFATRDSYDVADANVGAPMTHEPNTQNGSDNGAATRSASVPTSGE
jgi:hypothetical protein